MAGSMSDAMELLILNHILGGPDFTRPGTIWMGLWTGVLDDTSTGATGNEVSGGSYARLAVTNNSTNFPAASGGAKSNGVDFTFVAATAAWGTILYWADLTVAKNIQNGDTAKFSAGDLDFTQS